LQEFNEIFTNTLDIYNFLFPFFRSFFPSSCWNLFSPG